MAAIATQGSGKLAALNKCIHPDCTCTVGDGEQYCSDDCAESMQADERRDVKGCECGHAECATITVPLTPVGPLTT